MTKCFPPISMVSVFCNTLALALVCEIIWPDIIFHSNHNVGSGGLSSWLRGAWQLLIVRLWNGSQSNHPSILKWHPIYQSNHPSILKWYPNSQSIHSSILKWYPIHQCIHPFILKWYTFHPAIHPLIVSISIICTKKFLVKCMFLVSPKMISNRYVDSFAPYMTPLHDVYKNNVEYIFSFNSCLSLSPLTNHQIFNYAGFDQFHI